MTFHPAGNFLYLAETVFRFAGTELVFVSPEQAKPRFYAELRKGAVHLDALNHI